jgi:uncharacterized membrane protein
MTIGKSSRLLFVAAALFICASLAFLLPLLKLRSGHTDFYDLGQYVTMVHAVAFDGAWGYALRGHLQPFILLYALPFRLVPGGAVLLVLQSLGVVAGGILAGRVWAALGAGPAVLGMALYAAAVPVWASALFEFHFEHLIFPLYLGLFCILAKPPTAASLAWIVLLVVAICAVKEPYALVGVGLGLYLLIGTEHRVAGAALALGCLAYFFVATSILIPAFSDGKSTGALWGSGFGYLGSSSTEIVRSLILHPLLGLKAVFSTWRKPLLLGIVFGSLLFLPLLAPRALLPALPILAIALLSNNVNHFYIDSQYGAALFSACFVAAAMAIGRLPAPLRSRLSLGALAASTAALVAFGPAPISRLFWLNPGNVFHVSGYISTQRDAAIRDAVDRYVPADPCVVVATQNNLNLDRLSDRTLALAFPNGVFEGVLALDTSEPWRMAVPRSATALADIVVVDQGRPAFVNDHGCLGAVCQDPAIGAEYHALVDRLAKSFASLYQHDGFAIYRRAEATSEARCPASGR